MLSHCKILRICQNIAAGSSRETATDEKAWGSPFQLHSVGKSVLVDYHCHLPQSKGLWWVDLSWLHIPTKLHSHSSFLEGQVEKI